MSEHDPRVIPAYTLYAESSQRFDYFVTGGAGAALAFSIQTLDPGSYPAAKWLAPVGWFLLLLTLGAGLRHLQSVVTAMKAGAMINERAAERRAIRDVLHAERPKQAVLVIDTGEALSRTDAEARASAIDGEIANWERTATENERRMGKAYRVRNASVVAGLGVLALWQTLNLFQ